MTCSELKQYVNTFIYKYFYNQYIFLSNVSLAPENEYFVIFIVFCFSDLNIFGLLTVHHTKWTFLTIIQRFIDQLTN